MSSKLLEQAIGLLLFRENIDSSNPEIQEVLRISGRRFYGAFLMNMRRQFTTRVPTAGVNVTDGINLYINPDFFKSLSLVQRVELLIHECGHIMHYHINRAKSLGSEVDHKLFNIAADLTLNEPLTSLHEFGVTIAKVKEMIPDLLDGETTEYYYSKLKQEQDKLKQELSTIDDHGEWLEGTDQSVEVVKEIIKQSMKKAVNNAGGAGNVPGNIMTILENMYKSEVNWKQELRRFFDKSNQFMKNKSRKKRNRRYGVMFPGKRKQPILKIAIAVDTSGSISDEYLTQFFTEIKAIYNTTPCELIVMEADTEVKKIYSYDPKQKIEVTGRGGTCYQPVFNKVNEMGDINGLIYLGDMDIYDEIVTKPNYPVLWAMTEGAKRPVDWGYTCEVKLNKGK